MNDQRRRAFSLFRTLVAGLLPYFSVIALAESAKDFEQLEEQMESAFEQYVAALAERGETAGESRGSARDPRVDILQRMDRLAATYAGKPEGAEMAVKTFIWSAMFEIDGSHLIDRFRRIVEHYPQHDGTEEAITLVPDVYRASGSAQQWIAGLNAVAKSAGRTSTRVAAALAAGQLSLQTRRLEEAKKAFKLAFQLDPESESGELARGYVHEIDHLQIGMTAPDFTTTARDGRKVSLKDLQGKVVLLDFWATWCGPCLGEIPYLKKAAEHFAGKPFAILSVSLDDFEEMLQATLDHHHLPGIHTWEDVGRENKVATLYNAQVLPTWYLIDARGVIRAKDTFGDTLIPAVEKLLKGRTPYGP